MTIKSKKFLATLFMLLSVQTLGILEFAPTQGPILSACVQPLAIICFFAIVISGGYTARLHYGDGFARLMPTLWVLLFAVIAAQRVIPMLFGMQLIFLIPMLLIAIFERNAGQSFDRVKDCEHVPSSSKTK